MRDELLSVGSVFDWISPVLAFARSLGKGPTYTFLVPYACGWSGREVARVLKDGGIESWGYMVVDQTLTLTVRQTQANWAQVVLDQAGVPVENPLVGERWRGAARASRGSAQGRRARRRGDTLGDILDWPIL